MQRTHLSLSILQILAVLMLSQSLKHTIFPRKSTSLLKASISHATIKSNDEYIQKKLLVKPRVFFILGGPGAGKGTQCELLSNEYGMVHLSAGELLRSERLSGSANGNLIESYLKEGKIVPVQITLDLLKAAMINNKSNRYLIDGFPRNWDNIQGWEASMHDTCEVDGVIYIDCPESILESRILNRGLTSGRSDDNIDTIRKRFSTFKESTLPIIDYYEKMKKLIRVQGDIPKEDVFHNLKNAIAPLIHKEILEIDTLLQDFSSQKEWSRYASFCDVQIMTTIDTPKDKSSGAGLDFHKSHCFDEIFTSDSTAADATTTTMTVKDTHIEIFGKSANLIKKSSSCQEIKRFQLMNGSWCLFEYSIQQYSS